MIVNLTGFFLGFFKNGIRKSLIQIVLSYLPILFVQQSSTYVGTSVTVVRMLIIALVIASSIVISSAQNLSSECIVANETLFSNLSCLEAYVALLSDNATEQQQMMVCDEGEDCNTIIEDVIDECGDAVSL